MTDDTPVELFLAIANSNEHGVSIRFADGVQLIPAHIVEAIGGPSELEQMAEGLQNVLYDEFMQGVYSVMTSRKVNEMQAQIVANHFAPRFF